MTYELNLHADCGHYIDQYIEAYVVVNKALSDRSYWTQKAKCKIRHKT